MRKCNDRFVFVLLSKWLLYLRLEWYVSFPNPTAAGSCWGLRSGCYVPPGKFLGML